MPVLVAGAMLAACTFGGDNESEYGKGLLEPGTPAPDIMLVTDEYPDGLRLSSMRGGYVLLEFWASWCPDCRRETQAMKDIYATFAPLGLTLVGISFDEDEDEWRTYIAGNGLDWMQHREMVAWSESAVSAAYNIRWIPTLYLVDPQGNVRFATVNVSEMADSLQNILGNTDQRFSFLAD